MFAKNLRSVDGHQDKVLDVFSNTTINTTEGQCSSTHGFGERSLSAFETDHSALSVGG